MPQHKTNQFWKDPEFLQLIRKQQDMFRRTDKRERDQRSQEHEQPEESHQGQCEAPTLAGQNDLSRDKRWPRRD